MKWISYMLKYERINSNASFYENDSGCIINHIYIAPVVASNGSIIVESSIAKSIIERESLNKHIIHYQKTEDYLYNER